MKFQLFLLPLLFAIPLCGMAADLPGIPKFIDEMVEQHHFKREELERVFERAEYRRDVIEAISAPATVKPWVEYRAAFVNPQRINRGLAFWKQYEPVLKRAEQQYGVPQEMIVAIIGVETLYGRRTGRYRALDALTTLAFDYPRRADFFRNELAEYLLLAREQDFNLLDIRSSYAGALGIPQFMPSNYRKYAVDFNANGKVDLLHEAEDAIGSVANYFRQYGWKTGLSIAQRAKLRDETHQPVSENARGLAAWAALGVAPVVDTHESGVAGLLDFTVETGKEYWLTYDNFRVITLYNNSNFYAMSVFQLAEALRVAHQGSAD